MSVLRLSALHGAIVPLLMLGAGPALAQTTPSSPALLPPDAAPAHKAPPHRSMTVGKTTVSIKGYIKLDAMMTDYEARPAASLDHWGVITTPARGVFRSMMARVA